ncbi:MAG: hypothetical protein EAZ61_13050 [Oscillatoriales cyanobacterium]|nr:MAG: hypothetical protein EAZ61_13050 [Oscillatoriales cyanobacterium]
MQTLDQNCYCFCTAAYGKEYRQLCELLAQDLAQFDPGHELIVYTDDATPFKKYDHVRCYEQPLTSTSIGAYHQRRWAIKKALERYDFCICIDSDNRITEPINFKFEIKPGITARSCCSYNKHEKKTITGENNAERQWQYSIFQAMAHKLGVDPQDPKLTWVNEFLFIVARDSGRELVFLDCWERLEQFAAVRRNAKGPCKQIALAALVSGMEIRSNNMPGLCFFDDRVAIYNRDRGLAYPQDMDRYIAAQVAIEKVQRSFIQKVWRKLWKRIYFEVCWLRACIRAWVSDRQFFFF